MRKNRVVVKDKEGKENIKEKEKNLRHFQALEKKNKKTKICYFVLFCFFFGLFQSCRLLLL